MYNFNLIFIILNTYLTTCLELKSKFSLKLYYMTLLNNMFCVDNNKLG